MTVKTSVFFGELRRQAELDYRQSVRESAGGKMPSQDALLRVLMATGRSMTDFENDVGLAVSRVEQAEILSREGKSTANLREIEQQVDDLRTTMNVAAETHNEAAQKYELAYGEYRSISNAELTTFASARSRLAATRDKTLVAQYAVLQNEYSLLGQKLNPGCGFPAIEGEEAKAAKQRRAELEAKMAELQKRFDDPLELDWGRPMPAGPDDIEAEDAEADDSPSIVHTIPAGHNADREADLTHA